MTQPILQAVKAGFPAPLLIGIAPPTAPVHIFNDAGKTPAIYTSRGWLPAPKWQDGISTAQLKAINTANGNCGLRLGAPSSGKMFLAIDLDTDGDSNPDSPQSLLAAQIYHAAIKTLTERLDRQTLWVRKTRPDRATVIVALQPDADPGRIETIHFSHPSGVSAGKLQVLTKGQQTVIGGVHAWSGGTDIVWQEVCEGEFVFEDRPYPPVNQLPTLPDRAALDDLIADIIFQLEVSLDLTCSRRRNFSSSFSDSGDALSTTEQAAWGAQSFKDLLAQLPHDLRTTRDEWVTLMLSASGAIKAAKALGYIDDIDEAEMGFAAVEWSAKWEGPDGSCTDFISEQEKWDRDFHLANAKTVGWKQLINHAVMNGDHRWVYECAWRDFPDALDLPIDSVINDPIPSLPVDPYEYQEPVEHTYLTGIQTSRKDKRLRFDVKKSEIQIADYIEEKIKGKCVWVQEEKRWIMWSGPDIAWTNPTADAAVKQEIQNQLVYYVMQNEEHFGNDNNARASLTSERTVNAINKLLQTRMTVTDKELDKGDLCIQTPTGAWDLLTGKPFNEKDLDRQVEFKDRRMAGVTPKEGPTPLFDKLLEHLACGDQEVVDWLWSYFGYAVLGHPILHLLLIIYGPGGNGKGTVANTLYRVLKDYVVSLDRRVIVQTGVNDHPTGTKRAENKRLWLVSELNPRESWNESTIKAMSGGDMISARGMQQNMSEFKPEGSFYIYTQFVPALHRVDESIIRRFRMLHARIKVPDDIIDRTMEDKIFIQEGPAILARLMREAKAVVDRDWELVKTPASMVAEVKRYFNGQDTFALWFSETVNVVRVMGNEADVAVDILYESYKRYVKRNDNGEKEDDFMMGDSIDCMSLPAFTGALRRAGGILTDNNGRSIRGTNGKAMARGVKLKAVMEVVAA